jgi:hypothetical protein
MSHLCQKYYCEQAIILSLSLNLINSYLNLFFSLLCYKIIKKHIIFTFLFQLYS